MLHPSNRQTSSDCRERLLGGAGRQSRQSHVQPMLSRKHRSSWPNMSWAWEAESGVWSSMQLFLSRTGPVSHAGMLP